MTLRRLPNSPSILRQRSLPTVLSRRGHALATSVWSLRSLQIIQAAAGSVLGLTGPRVSGRAVRTRRPLQGIFAGYTARHGPCPRNPAPCKEKPPPVAENRVGAATLQLLPGLRPDHGAVCAVGSDWAGRRPFNVWLRGSKSIEVLRPARTGNPDSGPSGRTGPRSH